jgi:prevent-host-death family protein
MTTLPIADARAQLSKLVEEASSTHERIEITKNGHRAAVLLGAADYDAMLETIAVLSDSVLLLDHQKGLHELEGGDALNIEKLVGAMNRAGRRVDAK